MNVSFRLHRITGALTIVACVCLTACQFTGLCEAAGIVQAESPATAEQSDEHELLIVSDSPLPDTYSQAYYEVHLLARGGVPPLHWRLERGALPPGLKLEDDGLLHGAAQRAGEFHFTISVTDSGKPQQAMEKEFVIFVRSALSVEWKTPAHVNGNRIEGSVVVSNITPDDMDLTFIALAVAANGRATAIGYQHFLLPRKTLEKELPFGETLPRGPYLVHVDTIGEVASKNLIYREQLGTPGPLQVTVGP